MDAFSAFTGAFYLLPFSPSLEKATTIRVQLRVPLKIAFKEQKLQAETASPTQAETASGVCPTNLRISAGSSNTKSTK
jgi:hypothetical protein